MYHKNSEGTLDATHGILQLTPELQAVGPQCAWACTRYAYVHGAHPEPNVGLLELPQRPSQLLQGSGPGPKTHHVAQPDR